MNNGEFLQFERRGYYKIDKIIKENDDFSYELILTPDGKKRGIASIANQTDKKGDVKKKDLNEKIDEKKNKAQPKKDKKKKEDKKEEGDAAKEDKKEALVEAKEETKPVEEKKAE